MKICPHCGEEVRDIVVRFHKCAPSTENGKPKEEQKIDFLDFLWEGLKYSFISRPFYMMLSGLLSSRLDDENKFDFFKWLLYNTTTIIIPIWLVTVLDSELSEFVMGQLGIELGLVVLISPPILIWFAWKLKLKGKDTYAILFSIGHILIIMVYIYLFLGMVYMTM